MAGRRLGTLFAAVAVLATPFFMNGVEAQQSASSRYRVLVPDFQPMNNEDDDFGKDLAEELREAISQLNTHTAVDKDDIEDALDRFNMDMEDLNCIRSRQLASQSNYQVVLCATYAASGTGYEISGIQFVDTQSGEPFLVDPIMSGEDMEEAAAADIVSQFELFVDQTRRATFCQQYAQSQQWEQALDNCNRALELNPGATSVRYTKANVLRYTERFEESLSEIERILDPNQPGGDPFHENALALGGYVSIQMGDTDKALEFYRRQLELDPTNAAVRMRVAYEAAQEGDPHAAMLLIEDGMELDAENIDFYNQHGNFAFAAARTIADENRMMGGEEITPEVEELYLKAISSYQRVLESPDAEMEPSQIRNAAAAYLQLGEAQASADFSGQALEQERFANEVRIWTIHADALRELGDVDGALAALREVERIDPATPQLHIRMAVLLIQANRLEEALPLLQEAVASGTNPDNAADQIFAYAHRNYIAPAEKNFDRFIEVIELTEEFDVSDMKRQTYSFWKGYAIFQDAITQQEPSTLETAQATLPRFQEALSLFQSAKDYMDSQSSINYAEFIENTGVYIEIQEAIIKRGR